LEGEIMRFSLTLANPAHRSKTANGFLLQRKGNCGAATASPSGICSECDARRLQTKLTIGESNDVYEQEADRVAQAVLQSPLPGMDAKVPAISPIVQRTDAQSDDSKCSAPPIVDAVLSSSGQTLDAATRSFFEPRFGHDFSHVRVHTGAGAAESARSIGARAYTAGRSIVFGSGEYAPATAGGKRLLAHELTHVMQQRVISAPERSIQRQSSGPGARSSVPPISATIFHPGVNHNHRPSGRWSDVQANPNSGFLENLACAHFSPTTVVEIAIFQKFSDKHLALQHLFWYLKAGGADFMEDMNLDRMLKADKGVQALLAGAIPSSAPASGRFIGDVKVEQLNYQNQDFRFAFGAIDRLDFEVDFMAGTVHIWFQDRYEWHPVYTGLYTAFPDDAARETNCIHAALVELKSSGAEDFWMKGEATVPLSLFRTAPAGVSPTY
jgi:hypothetical protein